MRKILRTNSVKLQREQAAVLSGLWRRQYIDKQTAFDNSTKLLVLL